MKRLLILFVIASFLGVFHGWAAPAQAQAAFNCSESLGTPVYHSLGAYLEESWLAQCNNAQWKADFYVQYESGGSWHSANCQNSSPCHIRRPSSTAEWFAANSQASGTINFAVLNQCINYRVQMFLTSKGGTQFGPFASVKSVCQ